MTIAPSPGARPSDWPSRPLLAALRGWHRCALLALLLTACAHHPPRPGTPLPSTSRTLAILPSPSTDPDEADRSLAGAQLLVTALEAQQPALILRDIPSLLTGAGTAGACLLEPDRDSGCLSSLYQGPWLEVTPDGNRLALTWHAGIDAPERKLSTIAVDLPVEQLGPQLEQVLSVVKAPLSRDPAEIPPAQLGVCLEEPALTSLGAGLRALLQARLHSGDEAKALRQNALEHLEQAHTRSPTLLAAAWLAQARLEAGLPQEAAGLLNDPLPAHCGVAPALATRGRIRLKLGQRTEGVADLGLSARFRPFNDDALHDWAEGLTLEDRWADAGQVLRRALALTPENLDYRRRLADVVTTAGRPSEARAVLIEGLEHLHLPGERAWLELDLARLDEVDAQWRKAALHDERGLALLGDDGDADLRASLLNGLGVALGELGELGAAERSLEKAISLRRAQLEAGDASANAHLATSLYNLGILQGRQQRWPALIETLSDAAKRFEGEERLSTWLDLARLLQQGAQNRSALDILAKLKQESPLTGVLEAEWAYLQGLALAGTGKQEAAMEVLEQSAHQYAALGQGLPEGLAWFNLGNVAAGAGQVKRAEKAYQAARADAVTLGDTESIDEIDRRLAGLTSGEKPGSTE